MKRWVCVLVNPPLRSVLIRYMTKLSKLLKRTLWWLKLSVFCSAESREKGRKCQKENQEQTSIIGTRAQIRVQQVDNRKFSTFQPAYNLPVRRERRKIWVLQSTLPFLRHILGGFWKHALTPFKTEKVITTWRLKRAYFEVVVIQISGKEEEINDFWRAELRVICVINQIFPSVYRLSYVPYILLNDDPKFLRG